VPDGVQRAELLPTLSVPSRCESTGDRGGIRDTVQVIVKRFSVYVQHLLKYEAQALILASGAPVVARFATGERASNTPIEHAQLMSIVQEVAPAEAIADLMAGRPTRFPLEEGGQGVMVEVFPGVNAVQVTITPVNRSTIVHGSPATPGGPAVHPTPPPMAQVVHAPPGAAPPGAHPSQPQFAAVHPAQVPQVITPPQPVAGGGPSVVTAPTGPSVGLSPQAPSGATGQAPQFMYSPASPPAAPVPSGVTGQMLPATPPPALAASAPAQPAPRAAPRFDGARVAAAGAALHGRDFGPPGVDRWLRMLSELNGSDLHLSSGNPPRLRLHGEIQRLEDGPILEHEQLKALVFSTMPAKNREEFERRRDTDWAYEIEGLARFRGNAFMDRRGICAVFRKIPFEILSPERLGLPRPVLDLCNLTKGLVVVTGPTGSGKSTTLATLVDVINQSRDDHIITIEDPIEFVHENKRCLVNQREVRMHTDSFKDALRAALREDPDIVLVGEMRDLETVAIAIETAETGHLVFGTLHTTTAPSTVDRIIDQFSADRQAQIRTMLSESLKGVIAQVLCKKIGGGRIAAYEVLIGTNAVANLIREGKTFQLPGVMQTSRNVGMQTMNDSLMDLVKRGLVDPREAYMKSASRGEMRGLLTQAGYNLPEFGR
jgi:twitching motility protein PilT